MQSITNVNNTQVHSWTPLKALGCTEEKKINVQYVIDTGIDYKH